MQLHPLEERPHQEQRVSNVHSCVCVCVGLPSLFILSMCHSFCVCGVCVYVLCVGVCACLCVCVRAPCIVSILLPHCTSFMGIDIFICIFFLLLCKLCTLCLFPCACNTMGFMSMMCCSSCCDSLDPAVPHVCGPFSEGCCHTTFNPTCFCAFTQMCANVRSIHRLLFIISVYMHAFI